MIQTNTGRRRRGHAKRRRTWCEHCSHLRIAILLRLLLLLLLLLNMSIRRGSRVHGAARAVELSNRSSRFSLIDVLLLLLLNMLRRMHTIRLLDRVLMRHGHRALHRRVRVLLLLLLLMNLLLVHRRHHRLRRHVSTETSTNGTSRSVCGSR